MSAWKGMDRRATGLRARTRVLVRLDQLREAPAGGACALTTRRHSGQKPILRSRICCSARRTIGSVQFDLLRGEKRSAEREEGVGCGAERGVVMKAAPCAAF